MQQTQHHKPTVLAPADPLGARFCEYFNHPWHWITAPVPAEGKPTQWQTVTRYPLQPRNLWSLYQDPGTLVGLRFGTTTRYLLIDLDLGSPYHPATDPAGFNSVLAALETIGLRRALLVQSSSSGGVHIYFFLPQPTPTFALACALKSVLEDANLSLRQGELEVFPNVKAYCRHRPTSYNAHRLPLQDGSLLLGKTMEARSKDVELFLDLADRNAAAQDWSALSEALAVAQKRRQLKFIPGTSSKAVEWKRHLEERIAGGWTGRGQTNELLKDFATYGVVWQALSGDALVDYVEQTATAAPGYQQYCDHQHEIHRRALEWAQCCERFYSPYCSHPDRVGSYGENFSQPQSNVVQFPVNRANLDRAAQTQERIRQAIAHLEGTSSLPAGATARGAAIIATTKALTGMGTSQATLHKQAYLPLWHPDHFKQGVIDCQQPVSADSEQENPQPQKTLETIQDSLLHPTPLYEGLECVDRRERPQGDSLEAVQVEMGGGENDVVTAADTIAVAVASDVLLPTDPAAAAIDSTGTNEPSVTPEQPVALETVRRLARLRPEARAVAQRVVRQKSRELGRFFSWEERSHLEQVAKFRFYWESGEPILMREATQWAIANPDALPEALPKS